MPFLHPVLSATLDEQAQCLRAFSALRAANALAHFVEGEKRPEAPLEAVYVQQLGSLALRTVGIEAVSPHQVGKKLRVGSPAHHARDSSAATVWMNSTR